MDCPKCGSHNRDDTDRCRICGNPMRETPPKMTGPTRACPFCGAQNDLEAPFCTSCNKLLGIPTAKAVAAEKPKERQKYYDRTWADAPKSAARSARSMIGGIIMFMVAFFILADVVFTIAESYRESQLPQFDQLADRYPVLRSFIANIVACQSIRIVFAILAFVGAIAAIRRINYGLGIMGGVFGIVGLMMSIAALTYPWWLMLDGLLFIMAIVGLTLVAVSRREFVLV